MKSTPRSDPRSLYLAFWSKVDIYTETPCWIWTGVRSPEGYGRIRVDGTRWFAHRLAYTLTYGAIPAGLIVCHRCDNPPCCNPAHLFIGTHSDNARDSVAKGRWRPPGWKGSRPEGFPPSGPRAHCGERHHSSKLTEAQVIEIRARHAAGSSIAELAREYGLRAWNIQRVVKRQTWKHVP